MDAVRRPLIFKAERSALLVLDIASCPLNAGGPAPVLPNLPFIEEFAEEPAPSRPGSLVGLKTYQFSCSAASDLASQLYSAIFNSEPLYVARLPGFPAIERRLRRAVDGAVFRSSDAPDLPPGFPNVLDNFFSISCPANGPVPLNLVPPAVLRPPTNFLGEIDLVSPDGGSMDVTPVRSAVVKEEDEDL